MPFDLTILNFSTNALLARFLAAQRSFTGAGGAREVVESFGYTIGSFIEKGRRGTVPQWSAYDLGDCVLVLIDGIWTPQQAGAIFAAASLPPVPLPTPNVNAVVGSDSLSIWKAVASAFAGKSRRLLLAGYSYGGALAQVVAVIANLPGSWKAIEVCTFGAFRPGDATFAASLAPMNVHRWMNDNDPVPRFPPHLNEAPASVALAGPFVAATWQQYVQPAGGLVLNSSGAIVPLDLPPARIPMADADLAVWLTGIDQGKVAGHSLQLYSSRLNMAATLIEQGDSKILRGSGVEPFFPATQQGFNAAVADAAALHQGMSAVGNVSMPYIPVAYRPKAVAVSGSHYVIWMGFTICTCPSKSAAKTTAKYLFKHLRVLQGDSITSVSQLANAWAAFWAVAVSSSAGFDPPFQTSP